MMNEVIVRSSDTGAKLILSDPEFDLNQSLNYFVATIEDAGLTASSRIYAYRAEELVDLFTDIAKNWQGWIGEKKGEIVEGDLELVCTSDSLGHTFVEVRLSSLRHNWVAQATIRLDAGQLEGIAKQLTRFFGLKWSGNL